MAFAGIGRGSSESIVATFNPRVPGSIPGRPTLLTSAFTRAGPLLKALTAVCDSNSVLVLVAEQVAELAERGALGVERDVTIHAHGHVQR